MATDLTAADVRELLRELDGAEHRRDRVVLRGEPRLLAKICRLALAVLEPGEKVPEVTMQQLINAGLNAFALQLFVESIACFKDAATFSPISFRFRGIKVTLEPCGEIDTSHH